MIARKRSARATSRIVVRDRTRIEKHLDDLCRKLVVHLRDHGYCQRCGSSGKTRGVQWAHVFVRNYKRLRWNPDNSLALCAGCHAWFDHHKKDAWPWFAQEFPDRAQRLELLIATRGLRPKMDLAAEKAWLTQEIAKLEEP